MERENNSDPYKTTCYKGPLVEENEYVSQQSNSFLNRFYDGDFSAMLSAYLENNQLSETELNNLRSILSKNSK